MAEGYYRDICKLLRQQGYEYLANAKGSHEKWQHPKSGKIVIVPRHLLSRHTANAICKDIGLGKRF